MSATTSRQRHHDPLVSRVKAAVPLTELIASLGLRTRGRSLQCPNQQAHKHGDRTMSAWISATGWSWRCYACQAGGTVLDLLMAARGYSAQEAALALADYAGIPTSAAERGPARALTSPRATPRVAPAPEPPPPPASPETAAFLQESQRRLEHSDHAKRYLATRGVPLPIARKAGLGFAPRGAWPHARGAKHPRIVAPLTTPDGTLLTLYGRSTVMCPKTLRHDFLPGAKGVFHATSLSRNGVILVEGVFDALTCLAGGLEAAALCGLTTRDAWWSAIPAATLILALDADEAGQRRWETLAKTAAAAGKKVHCLKPEHLRGHKDLNEYWVKCKRLPEALMSPPPPRREKE